MAYEKTGYDAATPGRLPDLLDVWSVRRIKEVGADCLKILLYYAPADPQKVNDHKHAWVERIGDECRANDIPFFLEIIAYEEGLDEKGLEFAKKKPELVAAYMREFTKDRYGVDVLKVEVPINMKYVEGTQVLRRNRRLHASSRRWMRSGKPPRCPTKPFIYLSAGVSNAEFSETLELAGEAGTRLLRRAVRPRDLEGRHPDLREAGTGRVPEVARDRRREEHRQRQRTPQAGAPLVRVLWSQEPCRTRRKLAVGSWQ